VDQSGPIQNSYNRDISFSYIWSFLFARADATLPAGAQPTFTAGVYSGCGAYRLIDRSVKTTLGECLNFEYLANGFVPLARGLNFVIRPG
jgi:hypothetical protein